MPMYSGSRGRRRFPLTMQTRAPPAAIVIARFAVVVLPSPGMDEVKTIQSGWVAASTSCRLVRNVRNALGPGLCGLACTINGRPGPGTGGTSALAGCRP